MKKLISIILAAVLCFAFFTACSKNGSDDYLITKDSHYDSVSDTVDNAYKKLCTAVYSGEEEVKFNTGVIDDVYQLFYTCCPLYPLVENIRQLDNNTGVSIEYKNDYDKHIELVDQFTDIIADIMKECRYSKVNTDEYIFNVYTYISSNFKLDSSILTAFDTAIEGRGYNAAVNSLFEYLVLQGGGKASHILSSSGTDIISLVSFNGKYYYFDPAKEIENNSGTALKFFAMDNTRETGEFFYTDNTKAETVDDDTFLKLASSKSFTVKNSKVTVIIDDGSDYLFKLD